MCFSASASFIAAGGLTVVGVAALKAAPRKQKVLAAMPLLFAAQQVFEGIQWLALNHGTICPAAAYGFLAFAMVWWPIYIPGMVFLLDRRSASRFFAVLGLMLGAFFTFILSTHPLRVEISGSHIMYDVAVPAWGIAAALYVLVVCGAPIISHRRALRWCGVLIFIAGGLSMYISWAASASVWCFFSAIISGFVYLAIRNHWV